MQCLHLLQNCMIISTQDGDGVTVLELEQTTVSAPTYNLTVGDVHTFFVGDDGIWVHNVSCNDIEGLPNMRSPEIETAADRIFMTNNRPGDPIKIEGGGEIQILNRGATQPKIAIEIELSRTTGERISIIGQPNTGKVGDFIDEAGKIIELKTLTQPTPSAVQNSIKDIQKNLQDDRGVVDGRSIGLTQDMANAGIQRGLRLDAINSGGRRVVILTVDGPVIFPPKGN